MIFVSYAHPDLAVVRKLVAFLKSAGLEVWFDKDKLLAGQDWESEITKAIKQCSLFLVNISSNSIDRRGVYQKEIRIALDVARTIPPSQLYIMPVRLNECSIPEHLAAYHILPLYEENGPEALIKSIEFALKETLTPGQGARNDVAQALEASSYPEGAIGSTTLGTDEAELKKKLDRLAISKTARALLLEILKDDRSETKGISFMLLSHTQGFFVPYLWENHIHGGMSIPIMDITKQRMAADELTRCGVLTSIPQSGQLKQYALSNEFSE
jgi:hypothetical protein